MEGLSEAYLAVYEANRGEVYLNMDDDDKQKRRNIRWADNTHGIAKDNTIMIRDPDTARLVNKMRVSRHKKSPSLSRERTAGTKVNTFLDRQNDKREQQAKLNKAFSMAESNEFVIETLIDYGYADSYESAASIIEAMSDEWYYQILDEAPFDIYQGNTSIEGTKVGSSEPVKVNKSSYKNRKRAKAEQIN